MVFCLGQNPWKTARQEVHAYHKIDLVDFGSFYPVYYRGIQIIDGPHLTWKECYEALILNLLSHLQSEEFSELRGQVGKVIERHVFDTKIEQGYTLNHDFVGSSPYSWILQG